MKNDGGNGQEGQVHLRHPMAHRHDTVEYQDGWAETEGHEGQYVQPADCTIQPVTVVHLVNINNSHLKASKRWRTPYNTPYLPPSIARNIVYL